ncbi:MAG: hypothetical protein QWI73_06095 [Alphaproteobacteria bacterium]|nr:hypothetical protein [Alphaproteobacteria bacterium]
MLFVGKLHFKVSAALLLLLLLLLHFSFICRHFRGRIKKETLSICPFASVWRVSQFLLLLHLFITNSSADKQRVNELRILAMQFPF